MIQPAFRFAAYYGSFYFALGAFLPYFPTWLEGRGLGPEWIGWILAASLAGRTLVSPLGAHWADLSARRRDPILIFALAGAALFALHLPTFSPYWLLVLSFLSGAAFFGQIPLIDAFAMGEAKSGRITFGPVRAVGSALFIVSNFAAGAVIDRLGSDSVMTWVIAGSAAVALAARLLPDGRREIDFEAEKMPLKELWALVRGPFGLALAASTLIQGGHAFYYGFSALTWTAQGHSASVIGALWACGVVIEIVFLWYSGKGVLGRLSPAMLLAVGGIGSLIRWGLMALAPPLWALFLLQFLHALTFAATYLGFLKYAARTVPDNQAATAQAINSALSGGVVMAAASAISGYVYFEAGALGFAAMMLPAGLGLTAAIILGRVSTFPGKGELD